MIYTGFKRQLKILTLNRGIISDVLLWLVSAFILAYGLYFLLIVFPNRGGQTILLHFKDANEISPGSTVRMMGMDVGFVENLQFKQDHIDVKIKIIGKSLPGFSRIPSGSRFTILFTGLAGDKSIEIEPPNENTPQSIRQSKKPIYFIEEPTRMKDAMNAMLDEIQALQKGAENIDTFFGEKKPLEEVRLNFEQLHQQSFETISQLLSVNQLLRRQQKQVNQKAFAILGAIDPFTRAAYNLATVTQNNPTPLKPLAIQPLMNAATQLPKQFSRFNQMVSLMNKDLLTLQPTIESSNHALYGLTDTVQTFLDKINDPLNQAQSFLQKKSRSQHSGH